MNTLNQQIKEILDRQQRSKQRKPANDYATNLLKQEMVSQSEQLKQRLAERRRKGGSRAGSTNRSAQGDVISEDESTTQALLNS